MSLSFSSTSGSSGITTITISATSRNELDNYVENFILSNDTDSVLIPIVQKGEEPQYKYITISPSAITFPSSGGNQVVIVQSNVDWSWEMSEWMSVNIHNGTSGKTMIPITASANTGSTNIGAIKAISSDGTVSATTSAEQVGGYEYPYINLGYSSFSADSSSAATSVTVSSNVEWYTMASDRWITINTQSGTGDGSISFEIAENIADIGRSGTITVYNDGISAVLTIYQATSVKPYITLTPSAFTVNATGSSGNVISIASNCDYDIDTDVEWISVSSSSGSGFGSVSFTTTQSGKYNIGNIVFSNSELSRYVTVERKSASEEADTQ